MTLDVFADGRGYHSTATGGVINVSSSLGPAHNPLVAAILPEPYYQPGSALPGCRLPPRTAADTRSIMFILGNNLRNSYPAFPLMENSILSPSTPTTSTRTARFVFAPSSKLASQVIVAPSFPSMSPGQVTTDVVGSTVCICVSTSDSRFALAMEYVDEHPVMATPASISPTAEFTTVVRCLIIIRFIPYGRIKPPLWRPWKIMTATDLVAPYFDAEWGASTTRHGPVTRRCPAPGQAPAGSRSYQRRPDHVTRE